MPNQAAGGGIWTEPDAVASGVAVGARALPIALVAVDRYEIRELGTPGASLVARPYGYEIVLGSTSGTGVVAAVGDRAVIY